MEENDYSLWNEENIPDPDEIRERYELESDSDTLEPFVDEIEPREINADDPAELG